MHRVTAILAVVFGCIFFLSWPVTAADELAEADRLFNAGGLENFQKSIPIYAKVATQDPGSFEANWKCARAHREYANQAKRLEAADWKKICAETARPACSMPRRPSICSRTNPTGTIISASTSAKSPWAVGCLVGKNRFSEPVHEMLGA